MTAKIAKTTVPADEASSTTTNVAAEAGAATGVTKAVRDGKKAKPGATPSTTPKTRQKPAVADGEANAERKARTDTKQAKLIAMLQAKDGATVEEIAAAFGWQAHTVRGSLYGALKKKLGLDVTSEKIEGRGRTYRIGS